MTPQFPNSSSSPAAETTTQSQEALLKSFNTALLSSRREKTEDLSVAICDLVKKPAFKALLGAMSSLSNELGISPKEAADQMISTFRQLDNLWERYLIQEGLEQLRK